MSEREFNEIFAERLRYYLDLYEMSQAELARRIGVGTTSVYNWINAIKAPRMDKVDKMCEVFHCRRSDFISENEPAPVMLTTAEENLVEKYRRLDATDQAIVMERIDTLLEKKSDVESDSGVNRNVV